ncbi:hypothetical protein J6590_034049 [Homalodisca vitripennis]|nr:hypothetical protein J6590_034049 [Homalodisca vitripennis]
MSRPRIFVHIRKTVAVPRLREEFAQVKVFNTAGLFSWRPLLAGSISPESVLSALRSPTERLELRVYWIEFML